MIVKASFHSFYLNTMCFHFSLKCKPNHFPGPQILSFNSSWQTKNDSRRHVCIGTPSVLESAQLRLLQHMLEYWPLKNCLHHIRNVATTYKIVNFNSSRFIPDGADFTVICRAACMLVTLMFIIYQGTAGTDIGIPEFGKTIKALP